MARKAKSEAKLNKASIHDYDVILEPVLTEKTMALMQEQYRKSHYRPALGQ